MSASGSGHTARRALSVIVAVGAVVIGAACVLLAVTIGDCSAFGGRCPSDPQPLLEDDTFGMAAFGAALATGVPVFLRRPGWRRAALAIGVGVIAALVIGLAVRGSANS